MARQMIVRKSTFVEMTQGEVQQEYRVLAKLGSGSFGTVYRVQHSQSGSIFAMKTIAKRKITDMSKLVTEINVLREADLPQIITIHKVFEDRQNVNLVMGLCEGGDLLSFIIEKGSLTELEASQIARQVLLAVRYLHMHNISHRDIKPENIMFATAGDLHSLKLIDFGLAKVLAPKSLMKTKVGTLYYVSPDVLKGDYGIECDLWSFGVVLYFMLSGAVPFAGHTPSEVYAKVLRGQYTFPSPAWDSISLAAKDLIASLLLTDPGSRLTAERALEHPWLSGNVSDSRLNGLLPCLSTFFRCKKLRKAAHLAIAIYCTEQEIMELKSKFEALDSDHDGVISKAELQIGLEEFSPDQLADLVDGLDQDHNGVVNYSEFIAATLDESVYLKEERMLSAFMAFDKDRSGRITLGELMEVLGKECNVVDPTYWLNLLRQADVNGDGEIDFLEFIAMMQASPAL